LVGRVSSSLKLKVPLGGTSKKDFDAKVCILGMSVNIECTTRKDEFPYNLPPIKVGENAIPVYSGSRATLDPHDARQSGIPSESRNRDLFHNPVPESTVLRQSLSTKLSQLPEAGINLIVLDQISGTRDSLEIAPFGPTVVGFLKLPGTRELKSTAYLFPYRAYDPGPNGEPFRQLSAVLWFTLFGIGAPEYKLYQNPNATSPLPTEVAASLESVIA
jgi:hypothetical protein